jgi:cupin 2 domain-containing protein
MKVRSIFFSIPDRVPDEMFEDIVHSDAVRIERIISEAHATPEGYWYDQEKSEWVMVLKGSAGLLFEGSDAIIVMGPGDYVDIPAHKKHRVEWTDPSEKTIWLAVHY